MSVLTKMLLTILLLANLWFDVTADAADNQAPCATVYIRVCSSITYADGRKGEASCSCVARRNTPNLPARSQ